MEKTNWCDHMDDITQKCLADEMDVIEYRLKFCPICGTPRPTEKKVELPTHLDEDINREHDYDLRTRLNQLIDYLKMKEEDGKI